MIFGKSVYILVIWSSIRIDIIYLLPFLIDIEYIEFLCYFEWLIYYYFIKIEDGRL